MALAIAARDMPRSEQPSGRPTPTARWPGKKREDAAFPTDDCYRLERPIAGCDLHPLKIDALSRHTMSRIPRIALRGLHCAICLLLQQATLPVCQRAFRLANTPRRRKYKMKWI